MSIRKAMVAFALTITGALTTAAPAAAAPATGKAGDIGTMAACRTDNWRRLIHGQTGLNAVVEPGAPWHVRLQSGGGGYEKFLFCDTGPADDGAHGIAFFSNAHPDHYLTSTSEGRVSATGTNPDGMDRWFVCALDSTWVEIRFNGIGMYLGRNSAGYLEAVADTPNGNTLWHRSQFYGYKLRSC